MRQAVNQSPPAVIILTTVLLAFYTVRAFVAPAASDLVVGSVMPVGAWLTMFTTAHGVVARIISLFLVIITAINVLSASAHSTSVGMRNMLPFEAFVVGACGICMPAQSLTAYISAFLLTIAAKRIAVSYQRGYSFGDVFGFAFVVGLMPLIYAPMVVLLIAVPFVCMVTGRTFREGLVGLAGAFLPMLAASYIMWAAGDSFGALWQMLFNELFHTRGFDFLSYGAALLPMTTGAAFIIICIVMMFANKGRLRTKARRSSYAYTIMLVGLCLAMLMPCGTPVVIPSFAVLLALLSVNGFVVGAKGTSSVAYWAFLVSTVVYGIFMLAL